MSAPVALLLTDVVDSAALSSQLGDAAMAALWQAHDRIARDLLRRWNGQEIDKADGFLLLFDAPRDALGYALDYHRALACLATPLKARAGLHVGQVNRRETPPSDIALGAKPIEADGVSKPIAARVMSAALGGQTLMTAAAQAALGAVPQRVVSHGHWRVKGLPVPLELFEVGDDGAPFTPPPDSDKVFRVVRRGELWLPVRELAHTLPAERDSFVGRHAPLQELARRFDDGGRLVSVLGIGGCGKTRLATRFGWAWMGEFPGGVWFCDLAPARTLEGLYSAAAQGLQVPLAPDDPLLQLGHAIAGRGACLLILDNFEQLARHAERTLGRWLDRAPEARFLVTTREVLGIAGEEALALAPLPPDDAERLFLRRAAAARRDFAPDADDQAAIGPLVRLLDGLPLAIELAAARVRTLAPHALLARMSERFKLLASSGGRLDRQATLRAAFDWSWDLLQPPDKTALAQLSVFEGSFSLEAAEAVLDLSHLAHMPGAEWTVDVVHSLVDKSFVRPLGRERFDLLVSVQAYAQEHLQTPGRFDGSGPQAAQAALARHGAWYAGLGPQRAIEQACADLDNLVAACRRAVAAGRADRAAGALDGAWAGLNLHGPFQAALDLATLVCAMPALQGRRAATVHAGAAAHAHAVLGGALEAIGELAPAAAAYDAALLHAQAADDAACEAAVTVRLAGLHARSGAVDQARSEHAHALQRAAGIGNSDLQCGALNGMGTIDFEQGRMAQALDHWQAGLAQARQGGQRRWQGHLLGNLGNLHATRGDMDQASRCFDEALAIARELGDRHREGNTLCNVGMLHHLQGRLDDAADALDAAHAVARELGHAHLECIALGNLGMVQDAAGRHADAVARFEAALTVARRIGNRRTEGQFLGHAGLAHARQGAHAQARSCLDAGHAVLQDADDSVSLALLLCARAECEWLAGALPAAQKALDGAAATAAAVGAGPQSELGMALVRLRTLLGSVPG